MPILSPSRTVFLLLASALSQMLPVNSAQADEPSTAPAGKNFFDFTPDPPATQQTPAVKTPPAPADAAPRPTVVTPKPAEVQERPAAIPAAPALADATKLINDLHSEDFSSAKTPAQKTALAEKLLQEAVDEKSDLAGKYVLFRRSIDLAASVGDLPTAEAAVVEMTHAFEVDRSKLTADVAVTASKSLPSAADHRPFATEAESLSNDAQSADDYSLAKQLADLALAAARQSKDAGLIAEITTSQKQLSEVTAAFEQAKKSISILKDKPDDAEANLQVGRFRCYIKGDWATGLPNLVRGSDAKLAALASSDLSESSYPKAQSALADAWWQIALAEIGLARQHIQSHAAYWYRKALPELTGLTQVKAQRRSQETDPKVARVVGVAEPPLETAHKTNDRFAGVWTQPAKGRKFQLNADGTAKAFDNNAGTWTVSDNDTEIRVTWATGGWVDIYRLKEGKWIKSAYQNGTLKVTDQVIPPSVK